ELDIDGKTVCDIGAGTGRFSLLAAPRARLVIAIDGVPGLLERLASRAKLLGCTNIAMRRAAFTALPLGDATVDVAVACSAFTTEAPHGGDAAVDEAERIVRPGGEVAIIWPEDPRWLQARGYEYIQMRADGAVHFRDVATAYRLCAEYYSESAAEWVRASRTADVPYSVLGVRPPADMCIRRIPG
ncbi:MAG: class I SAM-dependent methyltransferase, partial [Candidatus Dormibacteraeota bacterium]|nr:class I SAM-dependent methyltransferase [Candidatus Dormibacteraeota bacterium]